MKKVVDSEIVLCEFEFQLSYYVLCRSNTLGSGNTGALGNAEYPFISTAPRSTLARSGSTYEGPIYGSNRTKLCTYAKLNCLK